MQGWAVGAKGVRGGTYLLVAHLSPSTIEPAPLSRRSTTAPTPNRDASNIWALVTFSPYLGWGSASGGAGVGGANSKAHHIFQKMVRHTIICTRKMGEDSSMVDWV